MGHHNSEEKTPRHQMRAADHVAEIDREGIPLEEAITKLSESNYHRKVSYLTNDARIYGLLMIMSRRLRLVEEKLRKLEREKQTSL